MKRRDFLKLLTAAAGVTVVGFELEQAEVDSRSPVVKTADDLYSEDLLRVGQYGPYQVQVQYFQLITNPSTIDLTEYGGLASVSAFRRMQTVGWESSILVPHAVPWRNLIDVPITLRNWEYIIEGVADVQVVEVTPDIRGNVTTAIQLRGNFYTQGVLTMMRKGL